jgi:hypothetical protein
VILTGKKGGERERERNNYPTKITGTFYPYKISNTTNTEMHVRNGGGRKTETEQISVQVCIYLRAFQL